MRFLLFVGVLLSSVHIGIAQEQKSETVIKTTLCEIKAHPEAFDKKLVEFRAIASHGFEDSMVESEDCSWFSGANPGVWMEYGGTLTTRTKSTASNANEAARERSLTVEGIETQLDADDVFKTFDANLHSPPNPGVSSKVRATMQGWIFAKKVRWSPDRPASWSGYGHLGCCMLFVLSRVVDLGVMGTPKK